VCCTRSDRLGRSERLIYLYTNRSLFSPFMRVVVQIRNRLVPSVLNILEAWCALPESMHLTCSIRQRRTLLPTLIYSNTKVPLHSNSSFLQCNLLPTLSGTHLCFNLRPPRPGWNVELPATKARLPSVVPGGSGRRDPWSQGATPCLRRPFSVASVARLPGAMWRRGLFKMQS
jgi:hypothetical protein